MATLESGWASALRVHSGEIPREPPNASRFSSGLSSWPSRRFQTRTNGIASGPLIITKRQATSDTNGYPVRTLIVFLRAAGVE